MAIRKFIKSETGMAVVEFAFLLPMLVTILIGIVEVSNYIFVQNKVERTAGIINNIISRRDISENELDNLLVAADPLMLPYDFSSSGSGVIVTAFGKDPETNGPIILWTRSYRSPGNGMTSAEFANHITLDPDRDETFIVTQVFFRFRPMMTSYLFNSSGLNIEKISITIPRNGSMKTLE